MLNYMKKSVRLYLAFSVIAVCGCDSRSDADIIQQELSFKICDKSNYTLIPTTSNNPGTDYVLTSIINISKSCESSVKKIIESNGYTCESQVKYISCSKVLDDGSIVSINGSGTKFRFERIHHN
jgi:hypothetical protein